MSPATQKPPRRGALRSPPPPAAGEGLGERAEPPEQPGALPADYYDGRSARRHRVSLVLEGELLRVSGDGVERLAPVHELRVSEPMGAAPRLITFADGAFCEVRDHAALAQLLRRNGHRDSFVVRWQYSLRRVAAAAALFLALGFAGYRYGIPWLAATLAARIPAEVSRSLSDQALAQLDRDLARESRLPPARREGISAAAARLVLPEGGALPHRILFRRSDALGANALALPS
ncbi:MAG: DUF7092 domain-containing protein, partial [Pseudomonadota bacterium]